MTVTCIVLALPTISRIQGCINIVMDQKRHGYYSIYHKFGSWVKKFKLNCDRVASYIPGALHATFQVKLRLIYGRERTEQVVVYSFGLHACMGVPLGLPPMYMCMYMYMQLT